MRVTICKDEKTAVDDNGIIYKINGVSIKKDPPKPAEFYNMETSFSKCCCAYATTHSAVEIAEGVINIL